MGEFVFKNLSVKLMPADGEAFADDECACCSFVVGCGSCTEVSCGNCTDVTCGPCTDVTCGPCTNCTECTNPTDCGTCSSCSECTHQPSVFCGGTTEFSARVARGGDVRTELAAHKARLQQALGQVEEEERKLEEGGKPQSIEEIDQLKQHFLEAIAELDEQRGVLEAAQEPDPE